MELRKAAHNAERHRKGLHRYKHTTLLMQTGARASELRLPYFGHHPQNDLAPKSKQDTAAASSSCWHLQACTTPHCANDPPMGRVVHTQKVLRIRGQPDRHMLPVSVMRPQIPCRYDPKGFVRAIVCQELHVVDFQCISSPPRVHNLLDVRIDGYLQGSGCVSRPMQNGTLFPALGCVWEETLQEQPIHCRMQHPGPAVMVTCRVLNQRGVGDAAADTSSKQASSGSQHWRRLTALHQASINVPSSFARPERLQVHAGKFPMWGTSMPGRQT